MNGTTAILIEAKPDPSTAPSVRRRVARVLRLGAIAFFVGTALLFPGCGGQKRSSGYSQANYSQPTTTYYSSGTTCMQTRVVDR